LALRAHIGPQGRRYSRKIRTCIPPAFP